MREDPFEDGTDAAFARFAKESTKPYTHALEALVGVSEPDEASARALYEGILSHQRELAVALGRDVHVRVAALDLLTAPTPSRKARDSWPILLTPHMLEKALEEASADPLTGLPQRAQFSSLVAHELRQRTRRPLAVAFIDLDGFKAVNDRHGHATGDEVLRSLARSAKLVLRHGDVLARLGGDEFALLLLDVDEARARAAVARLRHRFEVRTAAFGTSFSSGIAMAQPHDTTEDLLARADAAMYREKRTRSVGPRRPAET